MNGRAPLTGELIAKIAGGIDAIPPKPASRRELELLIAGIESQIRAAQQRGYTYAEIAEQITQSGYPIKTNTLRAVMQRKTKAAVKSRAARVKQSPQPTTGTTDIPASPPVTGKPSSETIAP